MSFKLLLCASMMFVLPLAVANPPAPVTPSASTATSAKPASDRAADRFMVDATIRLDGAVLGTPSATVSAGRDFLIQLGKEGSQRVTLTGMTAPINERSIALDFTLELEQWGKLGIASRRVSQTVKLTPGERYVVDGKDQDGKPFIMEIQVRPVPR